MFNLTSELEIKVSYMTIIHDKMHLCCGKNNLTTIDWDNIRPQLQQNISLIITPYLQNCYATYTLW